MSALGEYVHYYYGNYKRRGISRTGQNGMSGAEVRSLFGQHIKKTRSRAIQNKSEKDYSEIEQTLSSLMVDPASASPEIQAFWRAIEEQLGIDFKDFMTENIEHTTMNIIQNKDVKTMNLNTDPSRPMKNTKIKNTKVLERDTQGNATSTTTMKTYVSTLQSRVNFLSSAAEGGFISSDKILKEIEEIKLAMEELRKGLTSSNPLLGYTDYGEGDKNLIQRINTTIGRVMASNAVQQQKGNMFEYALIAAALVGRGLAESEIKGAMEQAISAYHHGKDTSSVVFNMKDWAADFSSALKSYYKQVGDTWVAGKASQDKIDVTLNWNGNTYQVSAKNINPYSGQSIHLVSKAPMTAMIQSLDHDFVNHYLNVVAMHTGLKGKAASNHATRQDAGATELALAHEAMRISLFALALKGYKKGAGQADTLIVNDNTKGKVKVYNVDELINKIKSNGYEVLANDNPIQEMRIVNDWQDTVEHRLQKLLADVHSKKITVGILPSSLGMT